MTVEYVIFLGVGKLIIYILQKFLSDNIDNKFVNNLVSCDLCLGQWCYFALALVMGIDLVRGFGSDGVFIVNQFITGAISSFMVHIFSIGWKAKFDVIIIE